MVLLTRADLAQRGIRYSAVQLWRREKAGTFPMSVKLSASRKGWIASEIDAWLADRAAERSAPKAA